MLVTIHPAPRLAGRITARGSKNYTSRHVLAASLATGESVLENPAPIDDAAVMIACCRQLGAVIDEGENVLHITGGGSLLQAPGELDVGNAGAVARFLMGVAAALPAPTRFVTRYPESLGKRPHGDLLAALERLGCRCSSHNGCLPITIGGGLRRGGSVDISGAVSSQFTSALLFLAPLLAGQTTITVTGEQRSGLIIGQTLRVLAAAGIQMEASPDRRRVACAGPQVYQPGQHRIPGDWPGAAAILAAAAVTESDVTVAGLYDDDGQGERAIVDVLAAMGADIVYDAAARAVHLRGGRPLRAVAFDGDLATDAVMAMVAAASLAAGTSRFYNIENLRYKESDRISDFCRELRKLGVQVTEERDAIVVQGNPAGYPGGGEVDGCHDHRLLMALSVVGLRCSRPIRLLGAEHISKSYPDFFADLGVLGAGVSDD